MRKLLIAAALLSAASVTTIAFAQDKPKPDPLDGAVMVQETLLADPAIAASTGPASEDARSLASDSEVGQARRAYRAACERNESAAFCECVTAGVAQALMPAEVRIAARTIDERINAQGDAATSSDSDRPTPGANSQTRIEQVEGHYADSCATLRR